jgi:hypothetical protein
MMWPQFNVLSARRRTVQRPYFRPLRSSNLFSNVYHGFLPDNLLPINPCLALPCLTLLCSAQPRSAMLGMAVNCYFVFKSLPCLASPCFALQRLASHSAAAPITALTNSLTNWSPRIFQTVPCRLAENLPIPLAFQRHR